MKISNTEYKEDVEVSAIIVCKGVSPPPPISKSSPLLLGFSPFLKTPHPPTLPANLSSQVFLLTEMQL